MIQLCNLIQSKSASPALRDKAAARLNKIQRSLAARADADWAYRANLETLGLAMARGEVILKGAEAHPTGPAMISSRDGLRSLHEQGHIAEDALVAGLTYRAGYEALGSGLRAMDYDPAPDLPHDNDRYVWRRLDATKRTRLVAQVDRRVAMDCRDHPPALAMLRRVAGEGHSLSAWGEGRALERNRLALIAALEVARIELRKAA